MTPVLEARGVSVSFGGVRALVEVDLRIEPGQLLGLIGPERGRQDDVHRRDLRVRQLPRHRSCSTAATWRARPRTTRARLGLARTWQSIELFDDLTVRENIAVAAQHPSGWRRYGRSYRGLTDGTAQVDDGAPAYSSSRA